ncbi:MAG: hypothetical protein J5X21_20945, partial [Candidatus Accumulibacter sp.]|nr:hypothetical protein [Candidatus Accumulibacter conexus]
FFNSISLIRPVMLGVGGFPLSWPLQDHKRSLSFRGWLTANDPEQSFRFLAGTTAPSDSSR